MKGCLNHLWRPWRKTSFSASSRQEASRPFDTSRGMQSSMVQSETMPDCSGKLIGIPISLWQLERDSGSPTSPREVSLLPCQASRRMLRCPSQLYRSPDVAEETRVLKGHPLVTREYTPGSCPNSRKTMRLPPRREMRPDSTALCAEEFRVPHQTQKEP